MKKIIAIMLTVCALTISTSAATPLYKPVKIPSINITLPHYDFSYAVSKYLEEHTVT